MTYTPKDIRHLEVMANLAKMEPVVQEPINISALLSINTHKKITMDEKILSLCSKLRGTGFEKQADSLEYTFANYKKATTHLYRAIDEDGEDLIDAAHPDGEVKVEDAQGDLGVVETIITEHKKLVDKVNKMPTGKLASYIDTTKTILHKQSQILDPVSRITYELYKGWDNIKQVFGDLQDKGSLVKGHLESLLANDNAKKFSKLTGQINDILPVLNKLLNIGPQVERLLVQPEGKSKLIKSYKTFFEQLQNALGALKSTIITAQSASETGPASKLYHFFVSSDFVDAKLSVGQLEKSLGSMIESLNNVSLQSGKSPSENKSINLNFDEEGNSTAKPTIAPNLKQSELDKLNGWKASVSAKNMDATNKSHILSWITGQISELQAANTPEQVSKIVEENKRFEARGLI